MSLTKVTLSWVVIQSPLNMTCNHGCMEFHHLSVDYTGPTLILSQLNMEMKK
jgi:hypothetical protein